MPVRTFKLFKESREWDHKMELLLNSCPAMKLPSPDLASASYEKIPKRNWANQLLAALGCQLHTYTMS
jgi:hypothetical protein